MNFFSILPGIGATLGLLLAYARAPRKQKVERTAWAALTLLAALIGARAVFVLAHPTLFDGNGLAALNLAAGGLSWPGALAGGLLMLPVAALAWRRGLAEAADALIPPLLIPLSAAIWLGCWQAGCAYGALRPQGGGWAMLVPDEMGQEELRFPLQPLMALLLALVGFRLERLADILKQPGQHASLALAAFAVAMLAGSFLRADSRPLWQNLPMDTWAAIVLGLLALAALLAAFLLRREAR